MALDLGSDAEVGVTRVDKCYFFPGVPSCNVEEFIRLLEWGAPKESGHGHKKSNVSLRKELCESFGYEYEGSRVISGHDLSRQVENFLISQDGKQNRRNAVSSPASEPIKKGHQFEMLKDEERENFMPFLQVCPLEKSLLVRPRRYRYARIRRFRSKYASLKNKYVMFCCFLAPALCADTIPVALAATCWELYHCRRNDFRMVAVVRMRPGWESDEGAFCHLLSTFPPNCLAVPFKEEKLRHSICDRLNLTTSAIGFLADPSGKILQDNINFLVDYGGKEAFPFDDEKLDFIQTKNAKLMSLHNGSYYAPLSLHQILGCDPNSDLCNVIDMGKKLAVSVLNRKLVWLYFCCTGSLLPKPHEVYEESKNQQLDIEVVLVYFPDIVGLKTSFFECLVNHAMQMRKISCWISPFDNSISRRLWRLSHRCVGMINFLSWDLTANM